MGTLRQMRPQLGTARILKVYGETGGHNDEATLSQGCGLSYQTQGSHAIVKISVTKETWVCVLDNQFWVYPRMRSATPSSRQKLHCFSCCYGKVPDMDNLRKERVALVHSLKAHSPSLWRHHSNEGMM